MANTNPVVKQTYACNGSVKDFAIPFFFLVGEESVIKVYLIDDATKVATLLALTTDYTLDNPATTVTTVATYAAGKSILLKRVSPLIQASEFIQGPFPFEAVEEQFDRVVCQVQEADDKTTGFLKLPIGVENLELPVPEANKLIGWNNAGTALENKSESDVPAIESNLAILTGRVDILEAQDIVTVAKDAAQDLRLDNHDILIAQAQQDIIDLNAIVIATGATMANFPAQVQDLQDQIDAINDRGADVDQLLLDVANLQTRVSDLEVEQLDIAFRVSQLEVASPISEFSGSQAIINNQVAPIAIAKMNLDGDGTQLGTITVQINRRTDTEIRITRVVLVMLYDAESNTWFLGRENTTFFSGNDDGLTFSVATDVNKVGQVSYVSDNMSGANYSGSLKFIGKEIPTGV